MKNYVDSLLDFIAKSPSCYHVVENFAAELRAQGYAALREDAHWQLKPGGKYFVTRNGSSILAFRVPACEPSGFMLAAAHSDFPTFKLKDNPEKTGQYVQLSTEKYGGMLMAPWFDRPLSIAGRVLVNENGKTVAKPVDLDRDLLVIPSVAIHMNRAANDGGKLLANVGTLPLDGGKDAAGSLMPIIAEAAGVEPDSIIGHDLYLYVRGRGTRVGANGEFVLSPKLDDLACAYGCMQGFLEASDSAAIPVCCVFDNEEVGSETKQGAASNLLRDTLRRVCVSLGCDEERYLRLLAARFMVSADNGHAVHPNHPEYSDPGNSPVLNGGVVVKFNANQRYTTDGVSSAIFRSVCRQAGVSTQVYANRSDLPGGSTLGSISNARVAVSTVDIGLAQLAMHSCVETAGAQDVESLVRAMRRLYSASLRMDESGVTLQ